MALKRSLGSRLFPLALAAALVLGAFTGCGKGGESPALEGTPPKIELDGYTLTLGQTTLQEVLDAGFEKVERLGFADETIAPYTFSSDLYYLARAGEDGQLVEYAGWGLCNTTGKTQATEACTLCSVYWQLAVGGEPLPGKLLINGLDFQGLAAEDVRQTLSEMEVVRDQGGSLALRDGSFTYQFSFGMDGSIESLEIYTTYPTR